jgi:hypothetical protein
VRENACFAKTCKYKNYFVSFDLWMCKGGVDTFGLILNYFTKAWESMYVTIKLFKVNDTIDLCMA